MSSSARLAPITAITVLAGEPLQRQEAADALRQKARALGFTQRNVFFAVPALDWATLASSLRAPGLFGDKTLTEIRLESGRAGRDIGTLLPLLQALDTEHQCVLILLGELARDEKNSAWFKALSACASIQDFAPVAREALPRWLSERLARQGQRLAANAGGEGALQWFADAVEGNMLAAAREIEKLALLYPRGDLTLEQLHDVISPQSRYSVFALSEAAFAGKAHLVARMLEQFEAEGEAPPLALWGLASDISAACQAKQAATQMPLREALRAARIWGAKATLLERCIQRAPLMAWRRLVEAAHLADGATKGVPRSGWPRAPWVAMGQLLLRALKFR